MRRMLTKVDFSCSYENDVESGHIIEMMVMGKEEEAKRERERKEDRTSENRSPSRKSEHRLLPSRDLNRLNPWIQQRRIAVRDASSELHSSHYSFKDHRKVANQRERADLDLSLSSNPPLNSIFPASSR